MITALLAVAMFLVGCPPAEQQIPKGAMTLLFTAGTDLADSADSVTKARVVQPEELESLLVSIDEVFFQQETDEGPVFTSVFSGPVDVDLVTLVGVSEIISSALIYEGVYSGVTLQISNPRVVFSDAPGVEVTDVELFDGGSFNVPVDFVVNRDDEGFLVLDLGGIHLVELDEGGFVLTPDFRVTFEDGDVSAKSVGVVRDLHVRDDGSAFFKLVSKDLHLLVRVDDAIIFLPDDLEFPSGTVEDLVDGARVVVLGAMNPDGSLDAEIVVVLRFADDGHPHDHEGEGDHEGEEDDEGEGEEDDEGEEHHLEDFHGVIDDLGLVVDGEDAFRLQTDFGRFLVLYTDAHIFLPGDDDLPTGTKEDLHDGAFVVVLGVQKSEDHHKTGDVIFAKLIKIDEGDDEHGEEPVDDEPMEEHLVDPVGVIDEFGFTVEGHDAFKLDSEEGRFLVLFNETEVFLPEDDEVPTGSYDDLSSGTKVAVLGVLHEDHVIVARFVRVIHFPVEEELVEFVGYVDDLGIDFEGEEGFRLQMDKHRPLILLTVDEVFLPEDGDVPTGTTEDLVNGAKVLVLAFHLMEDVFAAELVRVLEWPMDDEPVLVELVGVIDDFGFVVEGDTTFKLESEEGRFVVFFSDPAVFLPEDGEEATGTVEDLHDGATVVVVGHLEGDMAIYAEAIRILE